MSDTENAATEGAGAAEMENEELARLLHIDGDNEDELANARLYLLAAEEYLAGRVPVMSLEEYTVLLQRLVPLIPDQVTVHRLTGDGPKRLLLAPLWSADKKHVMNTVEHALRNTERRELP